MSCSPYDANDLNNYEGETYTGTDPYESASVWNVVDDVIGKTQNWELTALAMGMDTEDDLEFAADFIESPGIGIRRYAGRTECLK